MNCSMQGYFALFISLLLCGAPADAVLVERDWLAPADVGLTYDTETGLEWLDITATAGLSYNDVSLELGPGGAYEGFNFASQQQVNDLFASAGFQEIPSGTSSEGYKIEVLLNFWGVTWDLGTGERTEFLTANTEGLNAGEHWAGRVFWLEIGMVGADAAMYIHADDFQAGGIGSALVRPASPIPLDGDVNGDGQLNLGDFLIIQKVVLGHAIAPGNEPARADFYPQGNPDGIIGLPDYLLLHQLIK